MLWFSDFQTFSECSVMEGSGVLQHFVLVAKKKGKYIFLITIYNYQVNQSLLIIRIFKVSSALKKSVFSEGL